MKTANNTLHVQLVALFEQHPYIVSFSHDQQRIFIPITNSTTLPIHFDQIEAITINPLTVDITLCNEIVYTASLTTDEVRVTLPPAEK